MSFETLRVKIHRPRCGTFGIRFTEPGSPHVRRVAMRRRYVPHNSPLPPLPLHPLHKVETLEHPLPHEEPTEGHAGPIGLRLLAGPTLETQMYAGIVGDGGDVPPVGRPRPCDHRDRNAYDFSVTGQV